MNLQPFDLITMEENKVFLNSGLDEMMFAKTKFSLLMNETGFVVSKDDDGNFSVFREWKFDEIKTIGEKVYFCGKASGATVQDLIEKGDPQLENAIFTVCQAFAGAKTCDVRLPCNGPQGVIYGGENLIFLPEKTFEKSIANKGREVQEYFDSCWKDSIAEAGDKLDFSLACYAYFGCAKCLPYSQAQNTRIADRNFLPLEYCVNGICRKLSDAVNSRLAGEKTESAFPLDLLKEELFSKASAAHSIPENEFTAKALEFKQNQNKKVNREKSFRRNLPKAIAAAAFTVFLAIAITSIILENGKKPTVIGLNSTQVTEVFYKGLHTMDTDLMLAAAKECPQAQVYISQVPQLYVAGQMRSAYNFESGISTPENWMFFEPDSTKSYSHYIYGLTNFTVDEKPCDLSISVPTRKNHPHRIMKAENGSGKIEASPDAQHTVSYYLVHNTDNQILIEQFTTTVTLKYIKDRWTILTLDQKSSAKMVSPLPVSLAYKKALAENNGDEIKAVNSIRKEFYWLPSENALKLEKDRLDRIGY